MLVSLKIPTSKNVSAIGKSIQFSFGESKIISNNEKEIPHNSFSDSVKIFDKTTSIVGKDQEKHINVEIYPNPFTEQLFVKYNLQETSKIQIQVFDVLGKEITVLKNTVHHPGEYQLAINADEHKMQAGIYFIRIAVNDKPLVKRIIRVK